MKLADFDFYLPDDRIALRPANPRDSARMLVVAPGQPFRDLIARDLPGELRAGDVLVVNDTRVIPARLKGERTRGESRVKVEATLHRETAPDRWTAFMRPGKRLAVGDVVTFGAGLSARIVAKGEGGEVSLMFDRRGPDLMAAIAEAGEMPLPPYIAAKRGEDARDREDYQTVYAHEEGSVAAPTAGLHFDEAVLAALDARGVRRAAVTLHVGAGTFQPVRSERIAEHRMHSEWFEIGAATAAAIAATQAAGGRIVAVGTTSMRALESAALRAPDGRVAPCSGETDIFITPGFAFGAVDRLLTNFHLPRSTLMMLVSAFAGHAHVMALYRHAIEARYRFFSYGDCMLLARAPAGRA